MSSSDSDLTQIPVATLAIEHLQCLKQALSNLFRTSLAFETYSQVVDGQPISSVWHEYRNGALRADLDRNLEPSQEAQRVVEAFQTKWEVQETTIDAKVAQAYQDAPLGSREFNLRLIELVVKITHNTAASLFEIAGGGLQKPSLHRSDPTDFDHKEISVPPKPTLLYHSKYINHRNYPRGVADVVGYWAEYRLYGGVVLFDRGHSGTECNDVFVHPIGRYRIFQLSQVQIQQLVSLLLAKEPNSQPDVFPFRAEKYARRIDDYDSMSMNIYRDKYERVIPPHRPVSCVVRGEDFPEKMDAFRDWVRRTRRPEGDGA